VTRSRPTPRRLTLFSSEQATEASSVPLSGGMGGIDRNPYTEFGAQLNWMLPTRTTKLLHGGSFEVTSLTQGKFQGE
jgi:hypothetical protein